MTTAIEAIKKLLSCDIKDGSSHSHVLLKERCQTATLNKITLSDLSAGMLAFSLDKGKIKFKGASKDVVGCLSPLLAQETDACHHKSCDLVILKENRDHKLDIVYFEMKSGKNSNGATTQLASSHCFMTYVNSILRNLCSIQTIINNEKYVVFCGKRPSISKTATRYKPSELNSTLVDPEKVHVANDETVSIKKWLK